MSTLIEVLGEAVAEVAAWLAGRGTRRDRRMLREDRVRCAIRAVEGRVGGVGTGADIGTEWSTGECALAHGRIRFSPSTGIVGDRDIRVTSIRSTETRIEYPALPYPHVTVVLVTPDGDLLWAIPRHVADAAVDLLVTAPNPAP